MRSVLEEGEDLNERERTACRALSSAFLRSGWIIALRRLGIVVLGVVVRVVVSDWLDD